LHATLQATAERWRAGNRDWARLEADAKANLTACSFRPDYVEIRRADDLQRPAPEDVAGLRIFAAAWLGRARLIDNLPI
jgi:pantoate--beta-alanine ligase